MSSFCLEYLAGSFVLSIAVYTVSFSPQPEMRQGLREALRYTEISTQNEVNLNSFHHGAHACVAMERSSWRATLQVTLGSGSFAQSQRRAKLRQSLGTNTLIIAGFAGSTADAFSLFARFEAKLEQFNGNLPRAVVELAGRIGEPTRFFAIWKRCCWLADAKNTFILSGNGDAIEPDEDVAAIGSGRAVRPLRGDSLMHHTKLTAKQISEEAMKIAGTEPASTRTITSSPSRSCEMRIYLPAQSG